MLESAFLYNLLYAKSFASNNRWVIHAKYFYKIFFPFMVLFLSVFFTLFKNKNIRIFFIIFIFSCISLINAPIPRYYIVLTPLFVFLLVHGLLNVEKINTRILLILFSLAITYQCYSYGKYLTMQPILFAQISYPREPITETETLTEYLQNTIPKSASLYIMGSEPQVYFKLQKLSPTRFITKYPLMLNTTKQINYQSEELNAIVHTFPDFILISHNPQSFLNNANTLPYYFDVLQNLVEKYYNNIPVPFNSYTLYYHKKYDRKA